MEKTVQSDSPWKDVLDEFFPHFMAFFFPEAHARIDWQQSFKARDKEFQNRPPEENQGHITVDKLVEVTLLGGKNMLVLIHIEVQAQKQPEFAQRMFIYHARIFERYKVPVMSVAVLADKNPLWRPQTFEHGFGGCSLKLVYPIVKLDDYRKRWEELQASPNNFSFAVQAHLKGQDTEKDPNELYKWKLAIALGLNERTSDTEFDRMMAFIDGVMNPGPRHNERFWAELKEKGKGNAMAYVTSLERISMEKGRKKGRKEGRKQGLEQGLEQGLNMARENILEVLEVRFGEIQRSLRDVVNRTPTLQNCKTLHQAAIRAQSLEAFEKLLDRFQANGS